MGTRARSGRLGSRLARPGAGGLLYGAIVTAAVLVTAGGHASSVGRVVVSWAFVLGTYWLTHVYVRSFDAAFDKGDHRLLGRLLSAARAELPVLAGGVPGMAAFLVASLTARDVLTAEQVALYFTVVILVGLGYIGGRSSGRSHAGAWLEALVGGVLGMILVAAKTLLH